MMPGVMFGPSSSDDLARSFDLERRILDRLSTRVERFEHGVAYLDEEFRERYYSNLLVVDGEPEPVPADALLGQADRILGEAGCEHRLVVVHEDRLGERLRPAFEDRGYVAGRSVAMVHRRGPDRLGELAVEELRFVDAEALIYEMYRAEPDLSEATAARLTEQHEKFERVIGARFFGARVDGQLAGNCELYVDGIDAQVEHVGTLERFRGRGVARGVVLRAVEAATQAGARHIFIVSEEDDWPKDLYWRLGFDPVGRTWEFRRWPDGRS